MKRSCSPPAGFTIVEILVAATISLMLMLVVVNIVGTVGTSIARSRAALEMSDRLRAAQTQLGEDLAGVTVTMAPPRDPAANEGYFEYTEGPAGPVAEPYSLAYNLDVSSSTHDTTVGDLDDMLLFTTHSKTQPFVGKCHNAGTIQSPDAEVAWFVRGRTLYRRVLLVAPQSLKVLDTGVAPTFTSDGLIESSEWGGGSFFANNDISVRRVVSGGNVYLVPNTLGDLTKPENRFAHQPVATAYPNGYPYHPHTAIGGRTDWFNLRMPLLCETASSGWFTSWFGTASDDNAVLPSVTPLTASSVFDAWTNPCPYQQLDPITGALTTYGTTRLGEDVILTNVVGFDVKAWDPKARILQYSGGPALLPGDPGYRTAVQDYIAGGGSAPSIVGYGAYVDLGYGRRAHASAANWSDFSDLGDSKSNLATLASSNECVYDTWSTHYESNGIKEVGNTSGLTTDAGTNGFDDNSNGVVDEAAEQETSPPYPVPLRGIQVKIRVFEPDSRQVREVTVVQKF